MKQSIVLRRSLGFGMMMVLFLALMMLAATVTADPESDVATVTLSQARYVGPFINTANGYGGSVLIDIDVEPTTVSGYINFTDGPDVPGVMCGAGSFSGTRSGNNFSFSFVSNDPEPGCGPYNGITFNVSGTIYGNEIVNGSFTVPSMNQGGTFSAKQTIRSNGRFYNSNLTLDGDVYVDLAYWDSSIAGYINFTGDPGDPALCGANSFTGTRNGNALAFSFLSSDRDAGCTIMDDKRMDVTAAMSGHSLANGTYYVPYYGQGGTFSTSGPASDGTPPGGNVTSPITGSTIGVGTHTISANASDNAGGVGVSYVNFWVRYDGRWQLISTDPTPPYSAQWSTPSGLQTQLIRFAIDVVDKQGNWAIMSGGTNSVNFLESVGSNIQENWTTSDLNAYLNQLSLSPYGGYKCGGSSASMMLAINNLIPRTYNTLAGAANSIPLAFDSSGNPLGSHIYNHVRPAFINHGMTTSGYYCRTADDAWNTIRSEVDAGRPLLILSTRVTDGHYFVVVGYRYRTSNGNREVIVYDPYGKWQGVRNSYDRNFATPESHKGYWQTYDFDDSWGFQHSCVPGSGYLIVASPNSVQLSPTVVYNGVPASPPGEISGEPEWLVTYEGIGDVVTIKLYLPLVAQP